MARPRFGFQRIWVRLRREGWPVNRKRVRRLYRLEGLQLRLRVRRPKHRALHRGPAPVPSGSAQRWSMDVVHDALADGRQFRIVTVVDQWSRQSPTLKVGFRMNGTTVSNALDAVIVTYGKPVSITCDHGTEFMSRVLEDWAYTRGVQLDVTQPGKPTDNSDIESFNGKLRDECLNVTQFTDITHAQQVIAAWRTDDNEARPHGALGHLTPKEFADARQASHPQEAA